MLHPVGSQPPSVYWRRRLLVAASVIVLLILLVLTARAVLSNGDSTPSGQGAQTGSSSAGPSTPAGSTPGTKTKTGSTGATTTGKSTGISTPPPAKCVAKTLKVQAVVAKPKYKVGDEPVLTLQVTNPGPAPCVQDVGDPQIVLRVYNGASRVWGSHDCQTTPGVVDKTLAVGKAAGFSLTWSGLTAQPGCTGTRQRVGAGTYTLYASLAGVDGKAAQFTIA